MEQDRKCWWQERTPIEEPEPNADYLQWSRHARLTTYSANDPLCGYRGTPWHEILLDEELNGHSSAAEVVMAATVEVNGLGERVS